MPRITVKYLSTKAYEYWGGGWKRVGSVYRPLEIKVHISFALKIHEAPAVAISIHQNLHTSLQSWFLWQRDLCHSLPVGIANDSLRDPVVYFRHSFVYSRRLRVVRLHILGRKTYT